MFIFYYTESKNFKYWLLIINKLLIRNESLIKINCCKKLNKIGFESY